MPHFNEFDLEESIRNWEKGIGSSLDKSNGTIEKQKAELLEIYYNLQQQELSKQEAFLVATTRLGSPVDLNFEIEQSNRHILDLKKTALILSGILFYFFSYYLIKIILDGILIISINNGKDAHYAIADIKIMYIAYLLLVIASYIVFLSGKGEAVLQRLVSIRLNTKRIIWAFTVTVLLALGNHCLLPFYHQCITAPQLNTLHYQIGKYFSYAYPLIILLGLVFIYFKLFRSMEVQKPVEEV